MPHSHSHDPVMVALAILIAVLASYTSLDLTGRAIAAKDVRRQLFWLLSGAATLGSGIWTMHFTAIMTRQISNPLTYNLPIVLIAWMATIGVSACCLFALSRYKTVRWRLGMGTICMVIVLGTMNLMAFAAMGIGKSYSPGAFYLLLSILFTALPSYIALWLFVQSRSESPASFYWLKTLSACGLGVAIVSAHFSAVMAINFDAAVDVAALTAWDIHINILGTSSIIIVSLVNSFSLFLSIVDQRLSKQQDQMESYVAEITALNRKLKKENVRLGTEVELTRRLQQMILPRKEELDAIRPLDIAGYMQPADEVGGDYYDVLHRNGAVKIGIGDVTDHGLESGVVMLMTQTAVRTLLNCGETDPARFLDILNRTVYGNVQRMQTDRNLSLSLIDYEDNGHKGGQLCLSGQHEEMIVIRRDGSLEIIETVDLGFPIGLDDDIGDFFDHTSVNLEPGDGVVLYTDGITEAENMNGEQYGMDRLCLSARRFWSESAQTIQENIIQDLRDYIGDQMVFDDITILVVKQK